MKKLKAPTKFCLKQFTALCLLSNLVQPCLAESISDTQQYTGYYNKINDDRTSVKDNLSDDNTIKYTPYILGPGDSVLVDLLDVPEYSGVYPIGPDGTIYIPRLRSLYVEGLTVDELRYFLANQFSEYVKKPEVYVTPVAFRPIRVYISGEVVRPGFYYLSGRESLPNYDEKPESAKISLTADSSGAQGVRTKYVDPRNDVGPSIDGTKLALGLQIPTVFDAIRIAGGVTPFSDLRNVTVTRNLPKSSGPNKVRANLDFMQLITDGDESQNIKLFDGDIVNITKSPVELREQLLKAGQTNLNPNFVEVYVTGRVRDPGAKVLPQGVTLDQAIASAGGQKLLRGQVEFIRFNRNGTTDKRKFFLMQSSPAGSFKNPILLPGDIIRVNDSPLSATVTVLNELTSPAVGIYSVYSLFDKGF